MYMNYAIFEYIDSEEYVSPAFKIIGNTLMINWSLLLFLKTADFLL